MSQMLKNDIYKNFYYLLNRYKKNKNDKSDLSKERKLVAEYCLLNDESKVDVLITLLSEFSNKDEVVLTDQQKQEIEVYNQKTIIDLKNFVTKTLAIGVMGFILIIYIVPIFLDPDADNVLMNALKSIITALSQLF